jgi:hypothetical protein
MRFRGSVLLQIGVAVFLALLGEGAVAQLPNSDSFYASDQIHDIRIELDGGDWKVLKNQQPNPAGFTGGDPTESNYTYFQGTIWINGQETKNVGVRKKGFFGSNDVTRPSLKVKFDEYEKHEPIVDVDTLTLNNNKQDQSLLSQFLAYQVFRDAGIHAPRSNFARVTVNNKYLGVYSNVESIKKPWLKREFGNSNGALYEGTLADFHPIGSKNIEAKNKAAEDRHKVEALSSLLAESNELSIDKLNELIDVDYFIKYWTVENLLGFWDGYSANQNNYYLYFEAKSGKGYFIPWGADWVFTKSGPFAMFNTPPPIVNAQSILANRLYRTPGIPNRYQQVMNEVLDRAWRESDLLAAIDQWEQKLTPHLGPMQQESPQAMNELRDFIRERRRFVERELAKGPASIPDRPRSPAYFVPVGNVSGGFSTVWGAVRPGTERGEAKLVAMLDGKENVLDKVTVSASDFQSPRFGGGFGAGFGGPANDSVQIVFMANRENQPSLMLTVNCPKEMLKAGTPLQINGQMMEVPVSVPGGNRGPGGPGFGPGGGPGFGPGGIGNHRTLQGTIEFREFEMKEGAKISGAIKFEALESRGGMFGGRGFGGPPTQK